jgi:PST family polysaccharide transporter
MASQTRAILAGLSWTTIGEAGKLVIQLAGIAIMTRLLPPSDFGLVALASVITSFAAVIQDFGTSTALVQRKEINQQLISTIFWMNVGIGLGLCLIVAGTAPLGAYVLADDRLTGVLIGLSVVFPLSTAGAMHRALMQRERRYKTLVRQELINGAFSLGCAIVAAKLGLGVYALIVQHIVTVTLSTLQSWFSNKARPGFEWSRVEFGKTWHFTSHLLVFRTVNYFSGNADNILIGRLLGATELAWYSMAYRIMIVPIMSIGRIVTRVMLPHFSSGQDDPMKIGRQFVAMISLLTVLVWPGFALVWGLRVPFVDVVFGPQWERVADVLAWLALAGMAKIVAYHTGTLLTALGNTRQLRNNGLIASTINVVGFSIGVSFGIVGVAIASFVASTLLSSYVMDVSLKLVGQSALSMGRAVWRQGLFSAIIGVAAWTADLYLADFLHPLARLVLIGAGGGLLYLALLGLFARDIVREVLKLRKSARPLPKPEQ